MSVRENIELYGLPDKEQYIEILTSEFGAARHPSQDDAYILESLPSHPPGLADDHISVLSFNNVPLPDALKEASAEQAELLSDDILVRWTHQQDLLFEAILGQLRGRAAKP